MAMTSQERQRIKNIVAGIYAQGYSEGLDQAAAEYDLRDLMPEAALRMEKPLQQRLSLVDDAVTTYVKMLERKADKLRAEGLEGNFLYARLADYARNLADTKAEIISELEFAEARLDGAGHLLDESGMQYEWRFPHFELGRPGHDECPICEAIRERGPYTQEAAEAEGFPSFPHAHCDHGWVLVPLGQKTRTEEFPPEA